MEWRFNRTVNAMPKIHGSHSKLACILFYSVSLAAAVPSAGAADLKRETADAWDAYVRLTEKRIIAELNDGQRFLVADFLGGDASAARSAIQRGEVFIRKLNTTNDEGRDIPVPDGMIHHWYGSIFVPGVTLASLRLWLQDYDHHKFYFKEVEDSRLLGRDDSTYRIFFRLRRKKIVTVVYNTEYTAVYRYHGNKRISSNSHSTRIAEVESPGTPSEKEKPVGHDTGFLWRLNSYWRYQEEPGGVIVECESISLSRAIPPGLSWLIKGYVESVPRESLENTLTSIRDGSRKSVVAEFPGEKQRAATMEKQSAC
jgi:hypothetical protein